MQRRTPGVKSWKRSGPSGQEISQCQVPGAETRGDKSRAPGGHVLLVPRIPRLVGRDVVSRGMGGGCSLKYGGRAGAPSQEPGSQSGDNFIHLGNAQNTDADSFPGIQEIPWIHPLNQPHLDLFSSVAQSCPTLCDHMNRSTPGLPVHHQFPEFTQTHVHQVSNAIQPSHPLSSPSPPAPNPSQHQSLFQ